EPADRSRVPPPCQHGEVVPVTDPYDAPLSKIRNAVEDLAVFTAVWCNRTEPDAAARRCANDAVGAVDAAIRRLHLVRRELIADIREADDRAAERADAL